jgi:hypothetical protein
MTICGRFVCLFFICVGGSPLSKAAFICPIRLSAKDQTKNTNLATGTILPDKPSGAGAVIRKGLRMPMQRFDLLDEYTTICVPIRMPKCLPENSADLESQAILIDRGAGPLRKLVEGMSCACGTLLKCMPADPIGAASMRLSAALLKWLKLRAP